LPAQFKVEQPATTGEVTTLTLVGGDFATCTAPRSTSADNPKPVRQLWGSAKGKFRTVGRYSAATVRGTVWLTQDRCDGTLTQVVESIVDVLDVRLQKTIAVNPGESDLATPAPAAFKPPAAKGSAQKKLADRIKKSGPRLGRQAVPPPQGSGSVADRQGRNLAAVQERVPGSGCRASPPGTEHRCYAAPRRPSAA
jgi:hypothetical protein